MPKIEPKSIYECPDDINCLAFALGDYEPLISREKYNLDHRFPIDEAFLRKLKELQYENLPRQINSLAEVRPDEYVFMVFDFTPLKVKIPFMDEPLIYWDYHAVRRELDGSWVHKPGWTEKPCTIKETDWESLFEEFGRKYVLFALAV